MDRELFDIDKNEGQAVKPSDCVNINVGVLGHVDSGKTSICRVLTEVASTASLDKSPQSKERGITLDLGFSSFLSRVPVHLEHIKQHYLQFTLVDCPGHASLIRTIIGGAQIIDLMFLVIDINKGIQTQTAECIIIAEMFIQKLIIVLNKVDCLDDEKQLESKTNALRKVFGKTKFGQNVEMIPYSTKENIPMHATRLKETLIKQLKIPERNQVNKKFVMLIDHCFKIKGKGTILTGTVSEGKAKIGDEIQICEVQQKSKIKSIEMFRKPLNSAKQGDRVAMLMTHLQAEGIERGIACVPGAMKRIMKFVLDLNKVRLYKRSIKNKAKFHIISGHQTVMGQLRLFYSKKKHLDLEQVYLSINDMEEKPTEKQLKEENEEQVFAFVTLEKEIYGCEGQKIIGYKYDIENDEKQCRIAFHGSIQAVINQQNMIKLYKDKQKKGIVDRVVDNYTIIVKDLFDKDVNINQFIGKEIVLESGEVGKIEGSFGKSGKIRVAFKQSLSTAEIEGTSISFAFKKWYT